MRSCPDDCHASRSKEERANDGANGDLPYGYVSDAFRGGCRGVVEWYTGKVWFVSVISLPGPSGGIAMAHLRWRKYADLLLVP